MTRHIQLSCLLALAAAIGCGETTTNEDDPPFTFDRPVDIAFACYGNMRITNGNPADPAQPIENSAMPTSACEVRSGPPVQLPAECQEPIPDPEKIKYEQPRPPGQENLRDLSTRECKSVSDPTNVNWHALILQSGTGTVAIARFDTKEHAGDTVTVEDPNPFVPGKNSIHVGEDPVAIHVDAGGCHAITANAGSCDLSILELNSAFDSIGSAKGDPAVRVDRLEVQNASGAPIRARPAAMVGEPSRQDIGNRCEATPKGLAYVAYPSCHLVAAVDTSTGAIVSGIQYDAAGVPTIVGGDVTCPDECGGGGAVSPGVRPVTLDLEVDPLTATRRLAIGADNSASITMVELDQNWRPTQAFQVALEDSTGNLGVTKVALSREIGMGGFGEDINDQGTGGTFQFVYAVATDGTVRVADVLDERRECDTQVDPRFARAISIVRSLSCLPIGTPLTPRRAGAISPGIHLPGEAIPLSVELFRSEVPARGAGRPKESPTTLLGDFAAITASNGSVFIANVDDDAFADVHNPGAPLAAPVQLAMAHQLRDAGTTRGLTIDDEDKPFMQPPPPTDPEEPAKPPTGNDDDQDCNYAGKIESTFVVGGPRIGATPARTVPSGSVATEKLTQLPGFRQLLCDRRGIRGPGKVKPEDNRAITELQYAAPPDVRARTFPDLLTLPESETWSMIWEGSLSLNSGNSDVDGPAVREALLRSSSQGLHLLDDARPFCDTGVEPYDILQLRGCDPTVGAANCPQGHTCFVHPQSQLQNFGTCMLADEADRLADACKDFLTTFRRYTVKNTASGELLAVARRHELRTTPLDGCVSHQQCEELADYAARSASGEHPSKDQTPEDPREWECVADPGRAPMGGTGKRCQLRCTPPPPPPPDPNDPDAPDPDRPTGCLVGTPDPTADPGRGTVCQGGDPSVQNSGFCMEGVVPSQSCINATQRYELRAGEAFTVIGGVSGFVHPIIENAAGQCVRDPMASRLSIGRLPLMPKDRAAPSTLHMCDPAADPMTGQLPNGTFEPNPCLTTVSHTVPEPSYNASCDVQKDGMGNPITNFVDRQVPAVQFRNRNLTFALVDPYYPGDRTCIADRQGLFDRQGNPIPGQIPHVVPGLALSFRQIGGFVPMRVLTSDLPSLPIKVVRGPADSVWVVDQGDFLSSSSGQFSTRGKILRFHPDVPGDFTVLK